MRTAEAESVQIVRAPQGSAPWRLPLAAAALVTAAAHVPVTGEHLKEAPYIGVLFIALEIASVLLAAAVLLRPSRSVHLAISTIGALAVLALVISRTVGLPLMADDIGQWTEPLAVISVVAELVMTVGGLAAAFGRPSRTARAARVGLVAGIAILLLGSVATGAAAAAASAESDHDAPGTHMSGTDMGGMRMGLPAGPGAADRAWRPPTG